MTPDESAWRDVYSRVLGGLYAFPGSLDRQLHMVALEEADRAVELLRKRREAEAFGPALHPFTPEGIAGTGGGGCVICNRPGPAHASEVCPKCERPAPLDLPHLCAPRPSTGAERAAVVRQGVEVINGLRRERDDAWGPPLEAIGAVNGVLSKAKAAGYVPEDA